MDQRDFDSQRENMEAAMYNLTDEVRSMQHFSSILTAFQPTLQERSSAMVTVQRGAYLIKYPQGPKIQHHVAFG